jgi:hypothetical protein
MMYSISVEQTEEPIKTERKHIPEALPSFKKTSNPVSNISSNPIFTQDEPGAISGFAFNGEEAAKVLEGEANLCRESHTGCVIRQLFELERCSILEYRYCYEGNQQSIFVNPAHALVEDIAGPIQDAISRTDSQAQKAFDEKRYEDAFRLNIKALCMNEPSADEIGLRKSIFKELSKEYHLFALLAGLAMSLLWFFVAPKIIGNTGNFGGFVGLLSGIVAVELFVRDAALRFHQTRFRRIIAPLIGLAASLSGLPICETSFGVWGGAFDWIPFFIFNITLIVIGFVRFKERSRRRQIERHTCEFKNKEAIEAYVINLDKPGIESTVLCGLCLVVFCLAIADFGVVFSRYATRPVPAIQLEVPAPVVAK